MSRNQKEAYIPAEFCDDQRLPKLVDLLDRFGVQFCHVLAAEDCADMPVPDPIHRIGGDIISVQNDATGAMGPESLIGDGDVMKLFRAFFVQTGRDMRTMFQPTGDTGKRGIILKQACPDDYMQPGTLGGLRDALVRMKQVILLKDPAFRAYDHPVHARPDIPVLPGMRDLQTLIIPHGTCVDPELVGPLLQYIKEARGSHRCDEPPPKFQRYRILTAAMSDTRRELTACLARWLHYHPDNNIITHDVDPNHNDNNIYPPLYRMGDAVYVTAQSCFNNSLHGPETDHSQQPNPDDEVMLAWGFPPHHCDRTGNFVRLLWQREQPIHHVTRGKLMEAVAAPTFSDPPDEEESAHWSPPPAIFEQQPEPPPPRDAPFAFIGPIDHDPVVQPQTRVDTQHWADIAQEIGADVPEQPERPAVSSDDAVPPQPKHVPKKLPAFRDRRPRRGEPSRRLHGQREDLKGQPFGEGIE